MTMKKLTRIHSKDSYPEGDRLQYVVNLMKGEMTLYHHGKAIDDSAVGNHIWSLIEALKGAESQIRRLQRIINDLLQNDHDLDTFLADYLENYEENDPLLPKKYKLQELKARLFSAMRNGDHYVVSKLTNRVLLMQENLDEQFKNSTNQPASPAGGQINS